MVADFLDELQELMPHTLEAQPGFPDGKGGFTPSGAAIAIPCNIEGEVKLVRDASGREVTSTRVVYTGAFNDLTVDGHRYALPAGFAEPRDDLVAIVVDPASDEDGLLYEIVRFP